MTHHIRAHSCQISGERGTCMFVWECLKTEGKHLGMCMDGFMFGSCCVHEQDDAARNRYTPPPPATTTSKAMPTFEEKIKELESIEAQVPSKTAVGVRPTRPAKPTKRPVRPVKVPASKRPSSIREGFLFRHFHFCNCEGIRGNQEIMVDDEFVSATSSQTILIEPLTERARPFRWPSFERPPRPPQQPPPTSPKPTKPPRPTKRPPPQFTPKTAKTTPRTTSPAPWVWSTSKQHASMIELEGELIIWRKINSFSLNVVKYYESGSRCAS